MWNYLFSKEWFQVLIIATVSVVLAYYSLFYFAWGTGFDENLRYILSTLPQTQGAIVGIVASISIVAIQMVSQQYSTRITHLLLNKTFWGFIISYIVSMSYEVLILGFMPTARIPPIIWGYEVPYFVLIGILFFFVYFDFLILLPYMKNTINGLKPENVIESLINSISKSEIKNYKALDSETKDYRSARKIPKNTLRTVYYIIEKSLKSSHYMTARNGIILLGANYSVLAKKGNFKNKKFFESYIDNLKNLGLSVYGTSLSISREVIISLEKIAKYEFERNYDLSKRAVNGIKRIGLLYAQEYELKIDKADEKELIHIVFEKLGNIVKFILSKPKQREKSHPEQIEFKIMMYSEILRIFKIILEKLNARGILKNNAAGTLILDALNNFSEPAIEFITKNENSEFVSEITLQTSETLKSFVKLTSENKKLKDLEEITKIYGIILDSTYEKTNEKAIDMILSDISEIWDISQNNFKQIFGMDDIVENIDNTEKIKYADDLREQLLQKISK